MFEYIDFQKVWSYVVKIGEDPYDIYIGRPSKWGNPYSHKPTTIAKYKVDSKQESLLKFEEDIRKNEKYISDIKKELKGKILGCFCKPSICHGHILAWIANFE